MKIKMLTGMAGIHHSFAPGDVVERDDAEGERLIDAGAAELATDDAVITAWEIAPAEEAPATDAPAPKKTKAS